MPDGLQSTWLLTHPLYSHNYNEEGDATLVPISIIQVVVLTDPAYPVPVGHYLRDPQNFDFRPLAGDLLHDIS